jgi:hypothetical protein
MKRRSFTFVFVIVLVFATFCPARAAGTMDFAAASEMIQSDDAAGRAWAAYIARAVGAETDAEKIRAVCAWYAENMAYDYETVARMRRLPQNEHALYVPRYDYLSVLASVAAYVAGESDKKPKSLCGGYTHGVAGSLRALGVPVQIRIGALERTVQKGERYFDGNGVKRVSAEGGETPYGEVNGRWAKLTDLHARIAAFATDEGRWILVDPTFLSLVGEEFYFDMNETDYNRWWKELYVSAERIPRAWKENPLPAQRIVSPPAEMSAKIAKTKTKNENNENLGF